MNNYNLDADLLDILDIINFTLSDEFIDKWKYKYSTNFLIIFQKEILKSMQKEKPIRKKVLSTVFIGKYRYSPDVVDDFYKSIDIDLYRPIIL